MTQNSARNDYFRMFRSYPDVVHVDELREMLGGIGRTTAYALLKSGRIESVKMGRVYFQDQCHSIFMRIRKINGHNGLYSKEKQKKSGKSHPTMVTYSNT